MLGRNVACRWYSKVVLLFLLPNRLTPKDEQDHHVSSQSPREPVGQHPSCDVLTAVLQAVDRKALNLAIGKALPHLPMEHPDLVAIAQQYLLESPAPRSQLKLEQPAKKYYSQFRQDEAVDKLLQRMTNGFFLEVGAFEGEVLSNSLFFEKERNWTGLLVEPLPVPYSKLREKHRHAYTANVCLGTEKKSYVASFSNKEMLSGIGPDINKGRGTLIEMLDVLCVPLYTILKAIGQKRIDYFSLDIESTAIELGVLKSLPWGEIEFGIIDVEFNRDMNGLELVRQFMDEKGFIEVGLDMIDSFFMNRSLVSPNMPTRQKIPQILAD